MMTAFKSYSKTAFYANGIMGNPRNDFHMATLTHRASKEFVFILKLNLQLSQVSFGKVKPCLSIAMQQLFVLFLSYDRENGFMSRIELCLFV